MGFWVYLLRCADGSIYVGHTDDLERRLAQHTSGACGGFTADRLPIEPIWAQEFPTREEALSRELQIKGWSRAKKLALARQDWDRLHQLARSTERKRRPLDSAVAALAAPPPLGVTGKRLSARVSPTRS
jgi:putative endonuclease